MSTQTKDNFRKIINLWLMAFKMPGFCCGQSIILLKWLLWDMCSCSDKKDVRLTGKCCDVQPTTNLSKKYVYICKRATRTFKSLIEFFRCIISVLFSTECHSFHNFYLVLSKWYVLHKQCAKNLNINLVI